MTRYRLVLAGALGALAIIGVVAATGCAGSQTYTPGCDPELQDCTCTNNSECKTGWTCDEAQGKCVKEATADTGPADAGLDGTPVPDLLAPPHTKQVQARTRMPETWPLHRAYYHQQTSRQLETDCWNSPKTERRPQKTAIWFY